MKLLTILFSTVILFISCKGPDVNNAAEAQNEQLIKRFYEHFNNHDWTAMAQMYSETADFKDPSFGQEKIKQTRQQVIDKYSELNAVFEDIKDEIVKIYPSGDNNVIVEFISTGTAPDGSVFRLPICTIFTIENGLITKDYTYYDNFEDPE